MIPNSTKFRSIVSVRGLGGGALHKTFFELSYSGPGRPRLPHSPRSVQQPAQGPAREPGCVPAKKLAHGPRVIAPLAVLHARHLPMPSHRGAGEAPCNRETGGGELVVRSICSRRVARELPFRLYRRPALPRIMTNETTDILARAKIRGSAGRCGST